MYYVETPCTRYTAVVFEKDATHVTLEIDLNILEALFRVELASLPVTLTSFGTISAYLADIVQRLAIYDARFGFPSLAIVMQMPRRFVVEQRIEVAPSCHYDDPALAMKNYVCVDCVVRRRRHDIGVLI